MKKVDLTRKINWLIGTTLIGQGINFLILPFWFEIFGSKQVVTYGFLMVLANLLSPIFTCKYENLIFTKDETKEKNARTIAFRFLVSNSVFIGLLTYLATIFLSITISDSIIYAFIFTILTSIANIQFANCVNLGLRKRIEIYNLCRPLICAIMSIGFMFTSESPVRLVQSQSVGIVMSILIIITKSTKNERITVKHYFEILHATWKSQLFFVIESLIHNLDSNLVFLFLTRTFPVESTAAYYTSEKIFSAYSQIRIESVRPIYLKKFKYIPLNEAMSEVLSPRNREIKSNLFLLIALIPVIVLYILQTSPTHLDLSLLIWITLYQVINCLLKTINMLLVSTYLGHDKSIFILFNTSMQVFLKILFLCFCIFYSLSIISIFIFGTLQIAVVVAITIILTKFVFGITSQNR